jgi:hypothetical protein
MLLAQERAFFVLVERGAHERAAKKKERRGFGQRAALKAPGS